MIVKCSRNQVAADPVKKQLNSKLIQYCDMYFLFNRNGHLGQLFSRQENCIVWRAKRV